MACGTAYRQSSQQYQRFNNSAYLNIRAAHRDAASSGGGGATAPRTLHLLRAQNVWRGKAAQKRPENISPDMKIFFNG